jgi:putative FmdB family regulatory protein
MFPDFELSKRMPLYEITCADCGTTSEVLVKSSGEKPACPHCGSAKVEKGFSTFAAKGLRADHVHTGPCCPCGKQPGSCDSN